jgi:hypothetical protein
LLPATVRRVLGWALDAAAWERGRGWAFENPVGGCHYHELSNTTFHRLALRTIERLVADD